MSNGIDIIEAKKLLEVHHSLGFLNTYARECCAPNFPEKLCSTPFGGLQKRIVFELDSGECGMCKKKFAFGETDIDHIIPRHKGGTNELHNARTLCHPCHQQKSSAELVLRTISDNFPEPLSLFIEKVVTQVGDEELPKSNIVCLVNCFTQYCIGRDGTAPRLLMDVKTPSSVYTHKDLDDAVRTLFPVQVLHAKQKTYWGLRLTKTGKKLLTFATEHLDARLEYQTGMGSPCAEAVREELFGIKASSGLELATLGDAAEAAPALATLGDAEAAPALATLGDPEAPEQPVKPAKPVKSAPEKISILKTSPVMLFLTDDITQANANNCHGPRLYNRYETWYKRSANDDQFKCTTNEFYKTVRGIDGVEFKSNRCNHNNGNVFTFDMEKLRAYLRKDDAVPSLNENGKRTFDEMEKIE